MTFPDIIQNILNMPCDILFCEYFRTSIMTFIDDNNLSIDNLNYPCISIDNIVIATAVNTYEESGKKVAATPDMIKKLGGYKRIKETTDEECSVCLNNYIKDEGIRELRCGHKFHKKCIDKWFHKSVLCPICRGDSFAHLNQYSSLDSSLESSLDSSLDSL